MQTRILLNAVAIFSSVLFYSTPSWSEVIHVRPRGTETKPGQISGLYGIRWETLRPGDTILLYGGAPYRETVTISAKGAPNKPVTIKAAPGETPAIEGSIVLSDARHIVIDGLKISGSKYSGVIIKEGTGNVTVSNNTINNSGLGIWIGDGAGKENRLIRNEIFSNQTHGIAVDRVNCGPGRETLIEGNRIYNNGHHGIEINASYYIIEGNEVFNNCNAVPGCSGIHLYAKSPSQDAGDHNIIRYNVAYGNKDSRAQDGNGIQMDQWCDYNKVYHNISFSNDGAGINIFDGSHNEVFNNTLFGNMLDPGKTHIYKTEFLIASDVDRNENKASDIKAYNNIIVAEGNNYAIYVDRLACKNPLYISNNLLFQKKNSNFYFWCNSGGRDIAEWNRLKAGSGDDFYGDPLFMTAAPSRTEEFLLKEKSPALDRGKDKNQARDILGNKIFKGKAPDLGAIEAR